MTKAREEKSLMITWVRPSGAEITTANNPANVEYAKVSGWKKKSKAVPIKTQ